MVACGKTKKAYNADVVSIPSAASRSKEALASKSDEPPTASKGETPAATRCEKEAPLVFELAAPVQRQNQQSTPRLIVLF